MHSSDVEKFNKAIALANTGQIEQAHAGFLALAEWNPNEVNLLLWLVYTSSNPTQAEQIIKHIEKLNPNAPELPNVRIWLAKAKQSVLPKTVQPQVVSPPKATQPKVVSQPPKAANPAKKPASISPIKIRNSIVKSLVANQKEEAAKVLGACALTIEDVGFGRWAESVGFIVDPSDPRFHIFDIYLACPPSEHSILANYENIITKTIRAGFIATLPKIDNIPPVVRAFNVRIIIPPPPPPIAPIADNQAVPSRVITEGNGKAHASNTDNQGVPINDAPVLEWGGFRFRSQSEIRIAAALDNYNLIFLPNCKARLIAAPNRFNREPDFLVCYKGKWGILEVDGEPFHPATRTVHDHERDRLFRIQGIRVVEHYDATRCYNEPAKVVAEFLELLEKF